MKKIKINLLVKVLIAILGGIVLGQFMPGSIIRLFVTFNSLFANFLSFAIPLIIVGLVAPAIGELGRGAGKLLAITALLAYGSTLFSGFFTYFSCDWIFPNILPANTTLFPVGASAEPLFTPYFEVAMPPIMDVMTALLLSFTIGLGLSYNQKGFYFRIDHVFVSDYWQTYETHVDKSAPWSDHYPMITYLKKRKKEI